MIAEETTPSNPLKNPTYPQRVHIRERAQWQEILDHWSARVAEAEPRIAQVGDPARRTALERLHAQMLGARDQIADMARRLPMEVGDLYVEDRHRLEGAVAALERLFARWES